MTDTTHCPNCGKRTGYDSDGPIVLLRSDNLQAMQALFNREFDQNQCKVCHHKFQSTPTVVVNFNVDASIVMAPGSLFRNDYAAAMTRLLSIFAEYNPEHDDSAISHVGDMAALRAEAWHRLARRVEVMHAFVAAGVGEGSGEHFRNHWRGTDTRLICCGIDPDYRRRNSTEQT
jgi:hypothetical protein